MSLKINGKPVCSVLLSLGKTFGGDICVQAGSLSLKKNGTRPEVVPFSCLPESHGS